MAHSALAQDINSGLRNVVPIALSFTGKYFIPLNGKPVQVFPDLTEIDVVFPDSARIGAPQLPGFLSEPLMQTEIRSAPTVVVEVRVAVGQVRHLRPDNRTRPPTARFR